MNYLLIPTAMSRFIHNLQYALRRILPVITVGFSLLFPAAQSAKAFSFWGPAEGYQAASIGYNRIDEVDYQAAFAFSLPIDFSFFPHNIGEEFRWNVPNLFYAYDPAFIEYFGANGVRSVDSAFDLLNALPKTSDMVLNDFPLDEFRFNFTAQAFHLFDLKSATLEAMVTRLGLADPQNWTWTIHDRGALPGGCPNFIYSVVQRNFDPFAWTPTRYVNDSLFSYFIDQPCTPDFRADRADAIEFKVDPLDKVLTAVASPKITWPNINYYGMFHTSLTREDVAGLYYLYNTNNVNLEQTPPGVLLFQTNAFPVPLFSSNLTLFAAQALTNDATTLQTLYPGLVITASSNFYTTTRTTNVLAALIPGPAWAPAGTFTLTFVTNYGPFTLQTNFVHTFANVVTFEFVNGQWVIQPFTTFPTNGLQVVNFQTTSITVTNPPFLPAQDFAIVSNTVNRLRVQRGPVGEFFIFPTNFCDVVVSSVAFTNVVPFTNILSTSTNLTVGAGNTNNGGGTNLFNGQVLASTLTEITYFTNHLFVVTPVLCNPDTVALRSGVDKINFIRQDFDPLLGRFFRPITNDYTGFAETTNHIRYIEHFRRIVFQPDILITAADDDGLIPHTIVHDAGPGTFGPTNGTVRTGEFLGPMTLTYNKGGPVYLNQSPGFPDERVSIFYFQWASFDGSTNAPALYPDTASITNLQRAFSMSITPSMPPAAIQGQAYSATLQITGGQPPYSWSLAPGSLPLPPGISLDQDPNDSSQATLSGTPTDIGSFPFRIQITDGSGLTVNAAEALQVNPP